MGLSKDEHFKSFTDPAELLDGKRFTFLADNVLFYVNEEGKYVVFAIDPGAVYSKEHYLKLPEGAPYQLLDGKLVQMPSPKTLHQLITSQQGVLIHAESSSLFETIRHKFCDVGR